MAPTESMQMAVEAMSAILDKHGIHHAVIGGFAVQLLGHTRATSDIDFEIDVGKVSELRGRVSQLLIESDARFSLEHFKLFFTPSQLPQLRVPMEMLPIGELGLPTQLQVIRPGNGLVPILRPGILILTKIKRCATLIDSTRPKSLTKFRFDVSDIEFLLKWLVNNDEKVDFAGYQSRAVHRLYAAAGELLKHWKETGQEELVQLMDSVLEEDDREKIKVEIKVE
ncbi:hypothetical protein HRG_003424 [Hirsutella rhossiliensis]|uniref:Uncharacterized protein n=1 Tax=Hirsutella rhossiliensis TaxID=111463 RepID=A0A9P8MZN0_9HYPO|nr:uncharacterized protein HRG_03424 [Hirsutella rhossiliensis]KAH0965408.1 hypothetical protein HRG_03424 [Hirsutella rhossiliensis]